MGHEVGCLLLNALDELLTGRKTLPGFDFDVETTPHLGNELPQEGNHLRVIEPICMSTTPMNKMVGGLTADMDEWRAPTPARTATCSGLGGVVWPWVLLLIVKQIKNHSELMATCVLYELR